MQKPNHTVDAVCIVPTEQDLVSQSSSDYKKTTLL